MRPPTDSTAADVFRCCLAGGQQFLHCSSPNARENCDGFRFWPQDKIPRMHLLQDDNIPKGRQYEKQTLHSEQGIDATECKRTSVVLNFVLIARGWQLLRAS
jgi:hypothetical protein